VCQLSACMMMWQGCVLHACVGSVTGLPALVVTAMTWDVQHVCKHWSRISSILTKDKPSHRNTSGESPLWIQTYALDNMCCTQTSARLRRARHQKTHSDMSGVEREEPSVCPRNNSRERLKVGKRLLAAQERQPNMRANKADQSLAVAGNMPMRACSLMKRTSMFVRQGKRGRVMMRR